VRRTARDRWSSGARARESDGHGVPDRPPACAGPRLCVRLAARASLSGRRRRARLDPQRRFGWALLSLAGNLTTAPVPHECRLRSRSSARSHCRRRTGETRAWVAAKSTSGASEAPCTRTGDWRARRGWRRRARAAPAKPPRTCTEVWWARRDRPTARPSPGSAFGADVPAPRWTGGVGARGSIRSAAWRAARPSSAGEPERGTVRPVPCQYHFSKPRHSACAGPARRARAAAKTTSSAAPSGPTSPHGGGARISEKPRGFHRCAVANVRLLHMLVGRSGA